MNMDFDDLPETGDSAASKRRIRYCAQIGLLQQAIPFEKGGAGNRFCDLTATHEALGRVSKDPGLLLSINAHLWGAVFPVLTYGNESLQQTYLTKLISGQSIGGHAITEIQAGSDLKGLTASAAKTATGFVLNGHKRYITNAPIADFLVIYARLDKQLTAFIVHADDEGAGFLAQPQVSGYQSATMGDVILESCMIQHDRQLGRAGAGAMMIQNALELERAFIFAGIAGVMAWQLKTVIDFSRRRRVNGAHLGRNQAISHKIAEMKLRLDTIQLWVNECARLKDNNQRLTLASAQTKLYAAEAFLQSSLDSVQILGSAGLLEGSLMVQLVNDALASRLFSGSSEIQKNMIAALSGTGDGYKS